MNAEEPRRGLVRREAPLQLRFLTSSCFHRLPLFADDTTKQAFCDQLSMLQAERAVRLRAWVIMPEHVHLIIRPELPRWTVARVLRELKGPFARRVINLWKREDAELIRSITSNDGATRFWQEGGGYDRNIYSEAEVSEKTSYIHLNPVTRGLVKDRIDWRWSSARWYEGLRDGPLSIDSLD